MAYKTIQPSFAAGEFAPSLYSRIDIQKYSVACRKLLNFYIHSHGGASNRPGTRMISEAKYPERKARLVPFEFSTTQAYIIEFGHQYCRFFKNEGPILDAQNVVYEISSVYSEDDLALMKFAQSADVLFIANPRYRPMMLTRSGHANWTMTPFNFINGPYRNSNISDTTITASGTTGTITITASAPLFYQGHIGSWWRISSGQVVIETVVNSQQATAIVKNDIDKTTPVTDWAEGAWSDYRGWPATVTFFQERIVFGGSPSEPQTIWASKTGDYPNFGRSSPLTDTDGITLPLMGRKMNEIRNLISLKSYIIALTSAASFQVGPTSSSTAFTPTNAKTEIQEYWGSSSVEPVMIGNRALYVQPMGTQIRDMGYSLEADGMTGDDLTIFANHFFKRYSIVEMAYQHEPDSLVWAVRNDGQLLSLTYLREQQVLAWSRNVTLGNFEGVATIPGSGMNDTWFLVKRGNRRFIEKLAPRLPSTDPADQFFVDCGLSLDNPINISDISLANPIRITTATAHGLTNGDLVDITGIIWNDITIVDEITRDTEFVQPDQLNKQRYIVDNATETSFTIKTTEGQNVDGSGYVARVSDGVVRKAVSSVSLLDHLEGQTVAILADGNVLPRKVVTNGKIDLGLYASRVHVGLPYTADLETLNIELNLDTGTLQSQLVKVANVTIRFDNSRGGWLGPDEKHLTEMIQRSGEPLGTPIQLFSGDYPETLISGYDRGGRVFYRQRDPLPVSILAIMPEITPGG